MTHNDLYITMFKKNYKRYLLIFICTAFLISVCQFFASIAFNRSFMDMNVLDPMISSNILAPTFFTFAFSAFFIPYAHFSFNSQKEKDYGILETIGIDNKSIRHLVILENVIIASLALLAGLLAGTLFSVIFYAVIIHSFDIYGLKTTLNWRSYQVTMLIAVGIDAVTIAVISIRTSRLTISQLLNDERKVRTGITSSKAVLLLGIAVVIITEVYLFGFYNQNDSNALLIFFPISVTAIVLIVFNSISIIKTIQRRNPHNYYKNMVYYSNIRHKFSSSKKVFCFTIGLMGFIVFFQVFAFGAHHMSVKNVDTNSPFHIAYMEYNEAAYPSTKQIDKAAENAKIKLGKNVDVKYFIGVSNNVKYTVISLREFQQLTGRTCSIPKGECIKISQYVTNDGYPHYDKPGNDPIEMQGENSSRQFSVKSVKNEVIMNGTAMETEYCAVINNSDFNMLLNKRTSVEGGNIRAIQCGNMKQSEKFCRILEQKYGVDSQDISAKYIDEHKSMQADHFLMFAVTIMDVLLFLLNVMMIHFKLMSGLAADKKKYAGLWKIGYSAVEIYAIVKKDIRTMMIAPAVIAVLLGGTYVCGLLRLADTGKYGLLYTLIIGCAVLLFQCLISKAYARYYMRKLRGRLS